MTQKHTMPVGKAAEILGVSPGHLHNLDDKLHPVRDRHGRRWFDPEIVATVAAERAARPAAAAPVSPLMTRSAR